MNTITIIIGILALMWASFGLGVYGYSLSLQNMAREHGWVTIWPDGTREVPPPVESQLGVLPPRHRN